MSDPAATYPEIPKLHSSYIKLVGELIYLSINTRPDIAYVINSLAQHNVNPEAQHFAMAKRVLRYLAGTQDLCLHYGGKAEDDEQELHAYADASWANEVGRRSVSGYVWFYASGLISHISKKQTMVALSSVEAEYMAAMHVVQEGLWLCSLFMELLIPFMSPIKVYLDNTGAIALSTAAKFHQRLKHIDLRYHFIREHDDNNSFQLIWVSSYKNIADILMKPLPRPTVLKLSRLLGMAAP